MLNIQLRRRYAGHINTKRTSIHGRNGHRLLTHKRLLTRRFFGCSVAEAFEEDVVAMAAAEGAVAVEEGLQRPQAAMAAMRTLPIHTEA
jgi:S-adenosylmethionine:diacylglycerol 3-amino-3-carboxypropyl transferase